MTSCSQCGARLERSANFCSGCGSRNTFEAEPVRVEAGAYAPARPTGQKGFGQVFGIDPRIIFLTFVVDLMLFGAEGVTFGASVVFLSIPVGFVLAFITYKAQMAWYGDDRESALIKGCILGLLTAIPTDLPGFLYVPSGIIGLIHNGLGKRQAKISPARQ